MGESRRSAWNAGRSWGRARSGGPMPPLRLRSEPDYFSTQVSRRSTYWTGISL